MNMNESVRKFLLGIPVYLFQWVAIVLALTSSCGEDCDMDVYMLSFSVLSLWVSLLFFSGFHDHEQWHETMVGFYIQLGLNSATWLYGMVVTIMAIVESCEASVVFALSAVQLIVLSGIEIVMVLQCFM